MIKVISSGFYSSIQDLGRYGYRNMGVPLSGAMDRYSAASINSLLGNPRNAPVLESMMTGAVLEFQKPCIVALTGGVFSATLNDVPIENNTILHIRKGSVLNLGSSTSGVANYLGIKGGFSSETVLGSASYYNNLTSSSRLEKNATLFFPAEFVSSLNTLKPFEKPDFDSNIIKAMKGPEYEMLSAEYRRILETTSFKIGSESSRMGYVLHHREKISAREIISAPVQPGTIQLTPSGKLLVLMRDAQTTGGYARIFQLEETAINQLAQKRANQEITIALDDVL